MEKEALLKAVAGVREAWEAALEEPGAGGLEQPGANGDWRVRDVLAHFNGWDRWQLVQLRCAFTGEIPTDDELLGGIAYPPNDDLHEDAMNAMFIAGTQGLPAEEILRHWRNVSAMRADWVASTIQDQLDAFIGADWHAGNSRIIRLASEVPSVNKPVPVWQFILDQVEHQKEHLETVRAWKGR
jgi:hypothetical protein